MALLDLLGRRWTLRLLWELRDGPLTFRDLQAATEDISPSVLNNRLRALREAGLVVHDEGEGYVLTDQGVELSEHMLPLDAWARRWARRL
jgi:DNA-binding HxlR family transcriptional regulator